MEFIISLFSDVTSAIPTFVSIALLAYTIYLKSRSDVKQVKSKQEAKTNRKEIHSNQDLMKFWVDQIELQRQQWHQDAEALRDCKSELDSLEKKLYKYERQLSEKDETIQELKNQVYKIEDTITELETSRDKKEEMINKLRTKIDRRDNIISNLKDKTKGPKNEH